MVKNNQYQTKLVLRNEEESGWDAMDILCVPVLQDRERERES